MVSIIIPVFNNREITEECINLIKINTNVEHEIIVIDNGSEPPFYFMRDEVPNRILRYEENLGFPAAINIGIDAFPRGEYICLLNNDVFVTPGWLEILLNHLKSFDIVGPMSNYCIGIQNTMVSTYYNEDDLYKVAEQFHKDNKGIYQPVNWIVGFCMLFRKSLVDDIGNFETAFWPCCGEEIDFCYRAVKKGYKIAVARDVYIHHHGSSTFEIMDVDFMGIADRNHKHLVERWGNYETDQIPKVREDERKLNLGCGYRKLKGYFNVDNREEVHADLTVDLPEDFDCFPDDFYDEVNADDFLEHVPIGKTIETIEQIYRILKPGGVFKSITPDAEHGQGAFQDPTHVSFWVENSWLYYSDDAHRNLYGIKAKFNIEVMDRRETQGRVFHLIVVAKAIK